MGLLLRDSKQQNLIVGGGRVVLACMVLRQAEIYQPGCMPVLIILYAVWTHAPLEIVHALIMRFILGHYFVQRRYTQRQRLSCIISVRVYPLA